MKKELFDKNSVMLIGDYGGITIGDYFKKNFHEYILSFEIGSDHIFSRS